MGSERKGSSTETGTWQVTSTIMPGCRLLPESVMATVAMRSCPPCPEGRS